MLKNPLTTKCKACGREIMFIPSAATSGYRKIPVDAEAVFVRPDEKARGSYVLPNGEIIRGEIVPDNFDDETAPLKLAYVSHFATCSQADQFRGPRGMRGGRRG